MKLVILAVLTSALANQDPSFHVSDFTLHWRDLRVSWYANRANPWAFDSLPRSLEGNNGTRRFELKDDQCIAEGPKFVGKRYWHNEDPSVILLFDAKGTIAGIQTSVSKEKYRPYPQLMKYYIDDGDYWTMTAYFVDPGTICTRGRAEEELEEHGTGYGLWLQYGENAFTDTVHIPSSEKEIKKTSWGFGKCYIGMGQHYWYNVSKDMGCADYVPNCLLYNKGKLTGFCFTTNADLESDRYDNPALTPDVAERYLDPMPDCFLTEKTYRKLSTIHVYFIDEPAESAWC